jgi:microcystin-dependent protein
LAILSTSASIATPGLPVGSIQAFAGANAPTGWLLCDGSAVGRALYPDLFSTIGVTYGAGNTTTTFNLPDLRGRMPIGSGNEGVAANNTPTGRALGVKGGDTRLQSHTHTGTTGNGNTNHSHVLRVNGNTTMNLANVAGGSGGFGLSSAPGSPMDVWDNGAAHTHAFTTNDHNQSVGTGANMPPFLVTNYIIKAVADIARGGWYTQSSPPVVTQLPTNPAVGDEVYLYSSIVGRYFNRRWDGSNWNYLVSGDLQTIITQHSTSTQNAGAGSNYSIYAGLTTTITTHGGSKIIIDGNVGSIQPSTANVMGIVKCDYDNSSINPAVTTNMVAGTTSEWAHNGFDLKNMPFCGQTGTLPAGTYTFRVKVRSPQAVTLQWNWHSYAEQRSWLQLREVPAI